MTATSTTFLSDVAAVVSRGSAGGQGFADRTVYALPVGGGAAALREVQRVGLTPEGSIIVLFDELARPQAGAQTLILPPRLGGRVSDWTTIR